jgi:hypothetical protein
MPNPACKTCVPNKPETHPGLVDDTGCTGKYQLVKECMEAASGNVADCRYQWKDFSDCFAAKKLQKLQEQSTQQVADAGK